MERSITALEASSQLLEAALQAGDLIVTGSTEDGVILLDPPADTPGVGVDEP